MLYQAATSATPEFSPLLLATADLLRAQVLEQVFSPEEIAVQVLLSQGAWVQGMHQDKANLRNNIAYALGEVLEDPARRQQVEQVLQSIQSKAILPEPVDQATRQSLIQDAKKKVEQAVELWQAAHEGEDLVEVWAAYQAPPVVRALTTPSAYEWVEENTWVMLARQWPDTPAENLTIGHPFIEHLMVRLEALILQAMDTTTVFPPPPEPEAVPKVRKPGP